MTHGDSGWRPTLGANSYRGQGIWDHNVGPHEVNCGCVDPESDGDEAEAEDDDE
ncbi:hypothetical protein ACFQPA_15185 [Halomarina halobia]|uniref:Uncharacterized protein n=1 Tax=Halomarina halobia TaxID=3033386 RepID=A0ABD6A7K5_9EURY|nr:hypothetical protein [Halomarina sp. PSR21]